MATSQVHRSAAWKRETARLLCKKNYFKLCANFCCIFASIPTRTTRRFYSPKQGRSSQGEVSSWILEWANRVLDLTINQIKLWGFSRVSDCFSDAWSKSSFILEHLNARSENLLTLRGKECICYSASRRPSFSSSPKVRWKLNIITMR